MEEKQFNCIARDDIRIGQVVALEPMDNNTYAAVRLKFGQTLVFPFLLAIAIQDAYPGASFVAVSKLNIGVIPDPTQPYYLRPKE